MKSLLMSAMAVAFVLPFAVPTLAQERVTFASADSDLRGGTPTALKAFLYKPQGVGPFPAVVSMHGCDGLLRQNGEIKSGYGSWGEILAGEGYIVLLPDSNGSRGRGDLCALPLGKRPVEFNRERPRDAYGALAYLQSRSDVSSKRIAILGQSNGAMAVLSAIDEGTRPRQVSVQEDFRAAVAFYPGCELFLARAPPWAPRLPLLFLMGEADDMTPPAFCKALLSRVPSDAAGLITAHFYPGAYHAFDHPNLPVQVLTNVKEPPDGHSPTIGSNPEARTDATLRVKKFLSTNLN